MNEWVVLIVGTSGAFLLIVYGAFHITHVDKRLQSRGWLLMTAGEGMSTVTGMLTHASLGVVCLGAAVAAWMLWMW